MNTAQGLDISNYYGYITPAWAAAVVAAGIARVTVRASLERTSMIAIARHQITTFRDAGAEVDGYVWCYQAADNPDALAGRYMAQYGDLALPVVWLDLEDEDGWSYEDAARNCDWLRRALAGFDAREQPCHVYTGRWYWVKPNRYANTTEFSDRLLWASDFDRNPAIEVWEPFGGWEQLAGKQWCGESSGPEAVVAGAAVDRSTWNLDVLPGADGGSGEDDMAYKVALDDVTKRVAPQLRDDAELARASIAVARQFRLPKAAAVALATAEDALSAGVLPAADFILDQAPE